MKFNISIHLHDYIPTANLLLLITCWQLLSSFDGILLGTIIASLSLCFFMNWQQKNENMLPEEKSIVKNLLFLNLCIAAILLQDKYNLSFLGSGPGLSAISVQIFSIILLRIYNSKAIRTNPTMATTCYCFIIIFIATFWSSGSYDTEEKDFTLWTTSFLNQDSILVIFYLVNQLFSGRNFKALPTRHRYFLMWVSTFLDFIMACCISAALFKFSPTWALMIGGLSSSFFCCREARKINATSQLVRHQIYFHLAAIMLPMVAMFFLADSLYIPLPGLMAVMLFCLCSALLCILIGVNAKEIGSGVPLLLGQLLKRMRDVRGSCPSLCPLFSSLPKQSGNILLLPFCLTTIFMAVFDYTTIDLYKLLDKTSIYSASVDKVAYTALKENYLWRNHVPTISFDTETFQNSAQMLSLLKYKNRDKWSRISNVLSNEFSITDSQDGFGFSFILSDDGELRVNQVQSASEAEEAGIKRGFHILSIDGHELSNRQENGLTALLLAGGSNEMHKEKVISLLAKALRHNEAADFTFEDLEGNTVNYTLQKIPLEISTEPVWGPVITMQGKKTIGYLRYTTFVDGMEQLNTAFAELADEGIDELVIDLRYNGGGYINPASHLAALILNPSYSGKLFCYVRSGDQYNDALDEDSTIRYHRAPDQTIDLGLQRVFFLTTGNTASASELLINCLKPYIKVIQIGEKTHGKPVGTKPFRYKGHYFSLINLKVSNAKGVGNYFEGISPDCNIADDFTRPLGDSKEAMFEEALHYIEYGTCSQ